MIPESNPPCRRRAGAAALVATSLSLLSAFQASAALAEEGDDAPADGTRVLTKDEVNRIRFKELLTFRVQQPDEPDSWERIRVNVPRAVAEEFIKAMSGKRFYEGPEARQRFMKLSPDRKLHEMARESGEQFMDKVEIRADPEVFLDFRRRVLPRIMQGCATANCHGGVAGDKIGLKLINDPKKSELMTYQNFLLLDEITFDYQQGADRRRYYMIDRARPAESVLLAWLTRADQTSVPVAHPGDAKVEPIFVNTRNAGYQGIHEWIDSLRLPRPDYGVVLRPHAASQPAGKPARQP